MMAQAAVPPPPFPLKNSHLHLTFVAPRVHHHTIVDVIRSCQAIVRRNLEEMAFVSHGDVLIIYVQTKRRFTQVYTPGASRIFNVNVHGTVYEPFVQPMPRRAQDWISGGATWVTRYTQFPPLFYDDSLLLAFLPADDIDVVMINGYGFPRWRGGPMFLRGRNWELAGVPEQT